MENVVKYMCLQHDNGYKGQRVFCTQDVGENCIGLSGFALNYLLCAFIGNNTPAIPNATKYHIKWACQDKTLFPFVAVSFPRSKNSHQYVATRLAGPGTLNFTMIGRTVCEKDAQGFLRLEIQNTGKDLYAQILELDSAIHDQFASSTDTAQHLNRNLFLSLIEGTSCGTSYPDVCSAQNCLLLFFSTDRVWKTLQKFLEGHQDLKTRGILLSFLSDFCEFSTQMLNVYHNSGKIVLPHDFQRCFYNVWNIDLQQCLANDIIFLVNPPHPPKINSVVSGSPFLTVPQFQELIQTRIESTFQRDKVAVMRNLFKYLEPLRDTLELANAQLEKIHSYIKQFPIS